MSVDLRLIKGLRLTDLSANRNVRFLGILMNPAVDKNGYRNPLSLAIVLCQITLVLTNPAD